MENNTVRTRPSIFAASGFYLLAAVGLWLVQLFGDKIIPLLMLDGSSYADASFLLTMIYYGFVVMLPAYFFGMGDRESVFADRMTAPFSFWTMVKVIVIALLSLLIVQDFAVIWYALLQKLGLNVFVDEYIRPADTRELFQSVISAGFMAAVAEEWLFRGTMLSAWESRGTKKAVFITAALFAMLHGSLLGLPGEMFCGVLMGLLVIWTDSLFAGTVFHTVYNTAGVLLNYVTSAQPIDAAEEALMESDVIAYMGGWGTVAMLVVEIALLLAIIAIITRRFRLRYALRRLKEGPPMVMPGNLAFHPGLLFGEPEPEDAGPLSIGTTLLVMAGVVSALGLYIFEIARMLGG